MSGPRDYVVANNKKYFYTIRKSRRAKRVSINVDESGRVEVVVPWRVAKLEGKNYARKEAAWIGQKVDDKRQSLVLIGKKRPLITGSKMPLFGRSLELRVEVDEGLCRGRCISREDSLVVRVSSQKDVKRALERWYRERAYSYYCGRVYDLSRIIGVEVHRLSVSSAHTQWGSCIPSKSRISIQWRLALGPVGVADYVVAHELAHMKVRLHTKEFWGVVARMDRRYNEHRRWLRDSGHTLTL